MPHTGAAPFHLRPLDAPDAGWAARLVNACFAEHVGRVDPLPSALRETAETLAPQIAASGGLAAIVTGEGRADAGGGIGVMLWSERDGGLYLGRLAVAPSWRGRGVARALVRAAEAEAIRRSLPRLHLGTRLALSDNRRLFAACGFIEIAEHAHPGYARPTWVEMEKRLGAIAPP